MKKVFFLVVIFFSLNSAFSQDQLHLFSETNQPERIKEFADSIGGNILYATLNEEALDKIRLENSERFSLLIPVKGKGDVEIELIRNEILYKNFEAGIITNDKNSLIDYQPGLYYKGKIKGADSSFAAFSFFNNQVIGVLSFIRGGNIVVGTLKDQKGNPTTDYVIYDDSELNIRNNFQCFTNETPPVVKNTTNGYSINSLASNCVKIYFECDYEMYIDNGSNAINVMNYLTGMFNNIATLFSNEQITALISSVYIWTTADPYIGMNSSSDHLNYFRTHRTSFNGDIAHLLTTKSNNLGGIAYLDILCNQGFSYGFTNIYNFYNQFPTYSWTINAVTHEIGHNLGSPHTHACAWNGNNTAIDACGPTAGYPYEGSCNGAQVPSGGGTMMSYCHLLGTGVNFSLGFGPQPGNKIRDRVGNAFCLACTCAPTVSVSVPSCLDNGLLASYTFGGNSPTFQWKKNGVNVGNNSLSYLDNTLVNGDQISVVMTSNASCATTTTVTSNVISVNGNYCYCNNGLYTSLGCTDLDLINNFTLSNLSHLSSGCSGGTSGYGDFTTTQPIINLIYNTNYQWTATCPTTSNEYVSIWIDLNDNHSLTDPGELVYMSTSPSNSGNLSGSFTINTSMPPGLHRLRVRLTYGNSMNLSNACTGYLYGETQDYNCYLLSPIVTGTLASSYCAGSDLNVSYTTTANYLNGNIFRAQISNASGSFSPPTNIGSIMASSSGTIPCTIPANTPTGSGYRIRVLSSNPATNGNDNGTNIAIGNDNFSVSAGSNSPVCSGGMLNFNSSGGVGYSWIGPNGFSSSQQNPVIANAAISRTGIYTVTVSSNVGCTKTASTSVVVNQTTNYFADADGDGYGNSNLVQSLCAASGIYSVTVGGDCNDNVFSIHPGASEVCGNGVDDNCNASIDEGCIVNLNVKLYLEGFYSANGLMDNGGAGGNLFLLQNPGSLFSDVDTVTLGAMNSSPPYGLADSKKGILHTNGNVNVTFGPAVAAGNSYYIRVNHRNSIETWSKLPVLFSSATNYDFTTSNSKAFDVVNVSPMKLIDTNPDRWAIYSGDVDQDGGITSLDMTLEEVSSNAGLFGYDNTDVNGDGASNSLDMTIIETNTNAGIFLARP